MTFRVLADENVDHRTVNRLSHYGHAVEHIDFVPASERELTIRVSLDMLSTTTSFCYPATRIS